MPSVTEQQPLPLNDLVVEHIPTNLLLEPIEFIFADHCRQRILCGQLNTLCRQNQFGEKDRELAGLLVKCLERDLPLHIEDEEQDLFPHLQAKARPEDKFDDTLRLLQSEHDRDRVLVGKLSKLLRQVANTGQSRDITALRAAGEAFSLSHLSHLNWENVAVLELARLRLEDDDFEDMSSSMAARRKISLPGRL